MKKSGWILAVAFAVLAAAACGDDNNNPPDSGTPDAGVVDSGVPDAGTPDSGTPDAGTPDAGTPDAGTATLSISGFAFSPADFTVDPGTVITVSNNDSTAHTVTSEASDSSFTPGAVGGVQFDTGIIAAGGSAEITIPSDAPSGTVIPYYCSIHTTQMSPANGHITIR
jgi:plastocyanin